MEKQLIESKKKSVEKHYHSGITLIALVVTIVVLLILAGITIFYVMGDNGIIKMTQNAKQNMEDAMQKEQDDVEDLVDKLKEVTEGPKEKPIDKVTSYVGCYADMDGNGSVDGIIYADLAVGSGGRWNGYENYQYDSVSEGLKEYYVKNEKYIGKFYTEAKEVIAPSKGNRGKDRFYIMALEDVKDEERSNNFCWYDSAGGKFDKLVEIDANDFGSGKENTKYVMEKWDTEAWGAKNDNGSYNDLWGAIKGEVAKGWFLPSKSEWTAFGDMLYTKCGVTENNYDQTFGFGTWYWTSSQRSQNKEYVADFAKGYVATEISYYDGNFMWNFDNAKVRLSATF